MTRFEVCISICIGLLAAGIGPATASPGEDAPDWLTSPADTSRAFRPDGRWKGRAPWFAGDDRTRSRGGLGSAGALSANSSTISRGGSIRAAGQSVADPNLWGANGNVLDIARSGNTLYIAGAFRSVGENSGGFVPIDARTGEALRPFPKVAGSVHVIVPDGSAGWYIGGEFTAVAGKPRSCLARIRADGSVTDWNPSVTGSPGYIDPPAVFAMAIHSNRLFVGGGFRGIGGQPHENLGCVDVRTGAVLNWNLDTNVGGGVSTFAVHDSTIFVGGVFTSIGGQALSYLAALDATTGAVTPWQANPDYAVLSLLVRADTLFVGGQFGWIGGGIRAYLAALDVHTAQLLPFNADVRGIYVRYAPTPRVGALALAGDTLYAAGNFTQIGGVARASLAALNATTGGVLPWAPPALGPRYADFPPRICTALAVQGGTIYIGGLFETVGGQDHPFVAALNRETGAVTEWNPRPDLSVSALVVRGDTVHVGGSFSLVGEWKHRAGLAAIDLTTGALKPWNPNPNGSIVTALAVHDGRVYVSGSFTSIGGDPQPRRKFAALDTLNGEVTDWNPGANSVATTLLVRGDTLYACGEFTQVGGQPRNYLAALNATTGEVTTWDPNPNSLVLAMAENGNTIYVGGLFNTIGGQWRQGIAELDVATGAVTPWNPSADNITVDALLVSGNTVYVGGGFNQIGGSDRTSLAALDAVTGNATQWYPQLTSWGAPIRVRALALADGRLYAGGRFASIGGQPRICLAAVDTATGLATDWDPGLDGLVWSLSTEGSTVYVGGGFTRAGGLPSSGLAAFTLPRPPSPSPPPSRLAISQISPNPVLSPALVRFALPSSGPASLEVFDVQGRRVATIFRDEERGAGIQEVSIRTDGWSRGLYICQLKVGGATATRKMVIVE